MIVKGKRFVTRKRCASGLWHVYDKAKGLWFLPHLPTYGIALRLSAELSGGIVSPLGLNWEK